MEPIPTLARPTSARNSVMMSSAPRHPHAAHNNNNNNNPVNSGRQQCRATSPPPPMGGAGVDMLGAKAALSALQTGVVGERSSANMQLEKQLSVGSDVRSFAIVGSDVWMAHADGNISIRDCRTGHQLEPAPSPSVYRLQAGDRLLGQTPMPWCLLAVTPLKNNNKSGSSGAAVAVTGTPSVWVGFADGNIEVFDSETRNSLGIVQRHHSGGVYCLAGFSNIVFSGSNDFQIGMWDAITHSYLRQFSGHTNYVRCLHAEGALLFSGGDDGTVRVWNCTNGTEISRATFHRKSGVGCLIRVGPDMWSGDNNGDIIVWRLQTMREQHLLKEHTGRVTAMKKVGRSRVYSAAADRLVCVWDAFQHTLLHRVAEHNSWVLSLAFPCSLTRHYVWTGAADATVRCFHHDEFVPMTSALESALEGAWYACDYAPYRDLSESQGDELRQLRDKIKLLFDSERMARERAEHLEMHLDRARAEITEVDTRNHRDMEEVAHLKIRFADFDRREYELQRAVATAEAGREQMRQLLAAAQAENGRFAEEVRSANERVEAARAQSDHMASLLHEAVMVQEAAKMAPMSVASSTTASFGPRGSPRGGGAGAAAKGKTASPRAAPFSPAGSARYFGTQQRPLVLVTMGAEYQKVVRGFEDEIKELNEKIQRLSRMQQQQGRGGNRPGSAAAAAAAAAAGARTAKQGEQQQPQAPRDWASQATDILKARHTQKELLAMAAAATGGAPQHPIIPHPPAGAAAASGIAAPDWS